MTDINLEIDATNNDTEKDTEQNSKHENVLKCDLKQEETNTESQNDHDTAGDENRKDPTTEKDEPNISESNAYDSNNVHYEGDTAIYTDPSTGSQFTWDKDKNEWVSKSDTAYDFEDDTHVYTDSEGVKYFWDKEKNAWFPKVDDDFMARYQMNYGFVDNTNVQVKKEEPQLKIEEKPKKVKGEKRKASEPTWFQIDESQNTNVYVSNLPTDITEEEFIDLMQKCGLVMRDAQSGKFKIKLYKDPGTDNLKGDALCTYIRVESVDLSLKLLDGYDYKGNTVKVERAKFQLKGEFDPTLKPKMKKKKDKLKLKKQQEKLFDWRPEKKVGEKSKHERVVIVKNLFDPNIFDTDVGLILEFQQDLREECSKLGEVRKVQIYDRHPEGVAQINMGSPEEAQQIVTLLNGRWFMKRQLSAEIWDGKTKYKIAETDCEINQRLDNWDKFLEGNEEKKNENKVNENKQKIENKVKEKEQNNEAIQQGNKIE